MDNRHKENIKVIKLPTGFEEENRGAKSCCEPTLVLAHATENENWKNDLLGVYVKKSQVSDTVTISMENCSGTVLTNLGEAGSYPNDSLAVGFIYSWQNVLNTYGVGIYTVKVAFTVAGVTDSFTWGSYELKNYTIENALGTVRIYSEFNSYYQPIDLDFTNSNHKDTVRFNGFFGNREPKTDIVNYIDKGRKVVKATRENLNTYVLNSDPVTIAISRRILDFHLLNEDVCYITDHNKYNHDYLIRDKRVVLEESAEVEYITKDRRAKLTIMFGDRSKTQKSFYNKQ